MMDLASNTNNWWYSGISWGAGCWDTVTMVSTPQSVGNLLWSPPPTWINQPNYSAYLRQKSEFWIAEQVSTTGQFRPYFGHFGPIFVLLTARALLLQHCRSKMQESFKLLPAIASLHIDDKSTSGPCQSSETRNSEPACRVILIWLRTSSEGNPPRGPTNAAREMRKTMGFLLGD